MQRLAISSTLESLNTKVVLKLKFIYLSLLQHSLAYFDSLKHIPAYLS